MKVAFISDSGTGMNRKELASLGVFSVPLQITYGDKSFLENEDITIKKVNELMGNEKVLTTSLPPLGLIEDLFTELKVEGYDMIFAIPICKGLSGTINAMEIVAKQLEIDFDYFDHHVTAVVEKYMVIRAKELYEQGTSTEEIKNVLSAICNTTNTLLIPTDLQHLKRGGRLTPFAATLGGLLKIIPILKINKETQGKIDVHTKVRTLRKAMLKTVELMKSEIPEEGLNYHITVAHVDSLQNAKSLISIYKEHFPRAEFEVIDLVSVVSIHTGLGCLATQYYKVL